MASRLLLLGKSGLCDTTGASGGGERRQVQGLFWGDGICRERQAEARPPGDGRSEAWRGSRMRARRRTTRRLMLDGWRQR